MKETKDLVRVLVVDDTSTYRKIVSDVLATEPTIEVVGSAANGKIALDKVERLDPDVLILDLEMPEMDGLDVLRQLRRAQSQVGVIVLSGTSKHGADGAMAALELGAFDFLTKPDSGDVEENARVLERGLCRRIDAFVCQRGVLDILHGHGAPLAVAKPALPVADENDSALRTSPCAKTESGRPEVIALGISTGGPKALNQVLPRLPIDLPTPVLIVQHMPAVFTASLAATLEKRCALSVAEAVDGQAVKPGHILIAPGGKQMGIVKKGELATIRLTNDAPENSCRPSVDYLFRSVADVYGPRAVGVIMTGMGSDGALGCRQMKRHGATILAQDEESCVVFGMPRGPIEEGVADVVASLDEIAREIVRLARAAECK
ncbi:MAG: chemotaxis response regulator protein-glutamate methylesterase [bacterium]|nr:chemotaxis response regulator protein-glutamate methylesterase [bacterium]